MRFRRNRRSSPSHRLFRKNYKNLDDFAQMQSWKEMDDDTLSVAGWARTFWRLHHFDDAPSVRRAGCSSAAEGDGLQVSVVHLYLAAVPSQHEAGTQQSHMKRLESLCVCLFPTIKMNADSICSA